MPIRPRRPLLVVAVLGAAALLVCAPGLAAPDAGERARAAPPVSKTARAQGTTLGERAVRIALRAVGTPYRYGGESPESGFDCSGLVRWSYGRLGIELPHNSYALSRTGRSVAPEETRPGDVLLFAGLGHVGLYLGDGRMVHAPQSGRRVEIVRLGRAGYRGRIVGARRVAPA